MASIDFHAIVRQEYTVPAIPTTGTHTRGDFAWNTEPTEFGIMGWVCIASGTPGTWKQVGVPGVIVERDSNSNGEYVRYYDGTQIVWRVEWGDATSSPLWTFPQAFSAVPAVTAVAIGGDTGADYTVFVQGSQTTISDVHLRTLKNGSATATALHTHAIGRWY